MVNKNNIKIIIKTLINMYSQNENDETIFLVI